MFCLFVMRKTRQFHFSDLQFWDLRIREVKHLLELWPKLPRQIRESFSSSETSWLATLAHLYLAKLDRVTDLSGQGTFQTLLAAERFNDAALEKLRQKSDSIQVANQQRAGAQICILKILRLKQLSQRNTSDAKTEPGEEQIDIQSSISTDTAITDSTFIDIQMARNMGLDKIKEADRIFTENELYTSVSDGL